MGAAIAKDLLRSLTLPARQGGCPMNVRAVK